MRRRLFVATVFALVVSSATISVAVAALGNIRVTDATLDRNDKLIIVRGTIDCDAGHQVRVTVSARQENGNKLRVAEDGIVVSCAGPGTFWSLAIESREAFARKQGTTLVIQARDLVTNEVIESRPTVRFAIDNH